MAVVLGVDSSTQSTKVEAREIASGSVLGSATASHPPTTPPISEQDPTAWWQALVEACNSLPAHIRSESIAVSVAGQQHGLVLLDDTGAPVRTAKLWNDTTSSTEADAMVAALGAQAWAAAVGSLPVAAFTISKLAWVAAHEPQLLSRVASVMLPHDYLTWRLCDRHVTDRGDASGTGWFDPSTDVYLPELLDLAGVSGSDWITKLPHVVGPHEAAGELSDDAAEALGLPSGIAVGPGSGDNMGAALGLGLDIGDLVVSLGTSGVAYARSSTATSDPTGSVAGFADATGGFLPLVCTLNATKVTDTVAGWLGTDAAGLAKLAMSGPLDESRATVLPWFDGERTPNRPDAAGMIAGLRTDTTREEIALAAHDGVLCGLLNGLDALGAQGVALDGTLHLIGGGSRSRAYRQRCADLWQRSIVVPDSDETVATGAALQAAAIASGDDFGALAARWALGRGTTFEPAISPESASGLRSAYQALVDSSAA